MMFNEKKHELKEKKNKDNGENRFPYLKKNKTSVNELYH